MIIQMSIQKLKVGDLVQPKRGGAPFVIDEVWRLVGPAEYSAFGRVYYSDDELTLVSQDTGYVLTERQVIWYNGLHRCETDAQMAARHADERAAYDAQGDEV